MNTKILNRIHLRGRHDELSIEHLHNASPDMIRTKNRGNINEKRNLGDNLIVGRVGKNKKNWGQMRRTPKRNI